MPGQLENITTTLQLVNKFYGIIQKYEGQMVTLFSTKTGFQKGYNILSTIMTFALKDSTISKIFQRYITYRDQIFLNIIYWLPQWHQK